MSSYDQGKVVLEEAKNETVAIEKVGTDSSVPDLDKDAR